MEKIIKTEPLYLQDTYRSHTEATILKVDSDEQGNFLLLDQTIFHPQGGGQPFDTGRILYQGQEIAISVVKKDLNGQIKHYFNENPELDLLGKTVNLEINSARRLENAKLHSGGHLLGLVVEKLLPEIHATKGHHYPGEAYVEFDKALEEGNDTLIKTIQAQLDKAIADELAVSCKIINEVEFREIFGYEPKRSGDLRMAKFGDFQPLPCGGTHVSNLKELGKVVVSKIRNKNGLAKISYSVST